MVLLSLKVVKFDTKMYLNFSNFQRRTSAGGGGQALVQKQGQVSVGGIGKIFAGWGDPQSPPGKKPCDLAFYYTLYGGTWCMTYNLFETYKSKLLCIVLSMTRRLQEVITLHL